MKIKAGRYWLTHYEVGDTITVKGCHYRVELDDNCCEGCVFLTNPGRVCVKPDKGFGACNSEDRKDRQDIVFVKEN